MPLSASLGSRDRATGFGWLRPVWAAIGASLIAALPVAAQPATPAVIVDWSALSALPPSRSALAPVILHAPPERHVAVAPPPPRPQQRPPQSPPQSDVAAGTTPLAIPPAPSPSPQPVVAAASPPAPPRRAPAATPASVPAHTPARTSTVEFAPGGSEITPAGRALLDTVAGQLAADARLHLELVAYAGATGDDAIEARRIALARALQMRSYLIEKGVPSSRMDVRALGNRNAGGGPADRVDLVMQDR